MKKLVVFLPTCCMALAVAGAAAQNVGKDEMKKETQKGATKKAEMKKEDLMKDMSKGGMAKDTGNRQNDRKK
jgi:hypothetical protein